MSGEKSRSDRLLRLVAVQARKRQLEEWKLADLKREEIALAASSADILKSLGDQSLLHGLFLEAKAATLKRNEVHIAHNRVAQVAAEGRLREAQGIEKRLERASEDAGELAGRVAEQEALALALEDYLTAAAASDRAAG